MNVEHKNRENLSDLESKNFTTVTSQLNALYIECMECCQYLSDYEW